MLYVSSLLLLLSPCCHIELIYDDLLLYTCSDSISNRTLNNDVNIPAGTTAESCAAACQAAGGFTYAGLENGHECCE